MMAAVDWSAVGGVLAAVGLVISIVAIVQARIAGKQADAAARRAEEATLASVEWGFDCLLRPSTNTIVPPIAPVEITVRGANVWIHDVALGWKTVKPDGTTEDSGGGYCSDWSGPHTLPIKLHVTDPPLRLSWPPPPPNAQERLEADVWIVWSLSLEGHDNSGKQASSRASGKTSRMALALWAPAIILESRGGIGFQPLQPTKGTAHDRSARAPARSAAITRLRHATPPDAHKRPR